jgi:hypothetical protein
MPAAALLFQDHGDDVKKIEEPDAVLHNGQGIYVDSGKEDVKIGCAPGEKSQRTRLRHLQLPSQPVEPVLFQIGGGHEPHPGVQGPIMGSVTL